MSATGSTRQLVADFVVAFTPSIGETMTSMSVGAYEVPVGQVKDQTYRSKKRKKRGNNNQGRRPKTDARRVGKVRKEGQADSARTLVANAVEGTVGRPSLHVSVESVSCDTAERGQLPPDSRRVPLGVGSNGVLESRVRRGLRLELQGDSARLEDRSDPMRLRAEQEDR